MTAGRIIAYIAAAILIFFGVLSIWGAGSPQGQQSWIFGGSISVLIGFGLIWFATRKSATASAEGDNITYKIDLPADVKLDVLQCQSCGGELTMDHIKMVAGAPIVNCRYCNTTYQLKEEPKW